MTMNLHLAAHWEGFGMIGLKVLQLNNFNENTFSKTEKYPNNLKKGI